MIGEQIQEMEKNKSNALKKCNGRAAGPGEWKGERKSGETIASKKSRTHAKDGKKETRK